MYTKLIEHVIGVSGQVNTFQVKFPAKSNYTVRIFGRCPANRGCTVIVEDAGLLSDTADVLGMERKKSIISSISSISENLIGILKIRNPSKYDESCHMFYFSSFSEHCGISSASEIKYFTH